MKVLIVNTSTEGGAARACLRLHEGLVDKKIDSNLFVKDKGREIKNCTEHKRKDSSSNSLFMRGVRKVLRLVKGERKMLIEQENQNFILNRPKGLEFFSFPASPVDIMDCPLYEDADIIHLHWVANFLDWKSFFSKNKKPVVWTLHDQNPFLGGQHYDEKYLGMTSAGFPIERKKTNAEEDKEEELVQFKANILNKVDNITVVAPSRWLYESSLKSTLFSKYPHFHIPYGFPTEIYKYMDQSNCRAQLGISEEKIVLLFVSESVTNERKGYSYLLKAIESLPSRVLNDIILLTVGRVSGLNDQENVIELGEVKDENMMAKAYGSATYFVIPSLEDNFPNVMIESLLCGTPVIGFPTGGIVDVVVDGKTGLLCKEVSVNSLSDTIEFGLNSYNNFDRLRIAESASKDYNSKLQAERYTKLYQTLLK